MPYVPVAAFSHLGEPDAAQRFLALPSSFEGT
ncbi:hypothetical protein BRAS3843_1750079 [Bradyrhizobium sp. STM 3843]|nr:hypothetical protein BRAS3843_1750079 [Bradyrhizobium sp. STM 3843]